MWTIPNILTLIRLIAAPLVAVMFLYFTRPYADWAALILFVSAAITDWVDGFLARAWKQESKLGAVLDPIADKAMVVIALVVITGISDMNPWILLPTTIIIFREVFVSGLREFLGDVAGTLKVTQLAKWKTTIQMVAISTLFAVGIFEHHLGMSMAGLDKASVQQILNGTMADTNGLQSLNQWAAATWYCGVVLLWSAAVLTLITGIDYLLKAQPHLRD